MPGSFCAAKGCSNHSYNTREKDISFHRFPVQSPDLLKQWLVAIRRLDYTPTPYSRLCSLHFAESCFTYQNFTKRRQIKSDAVPTLFSLLSQGHHREGTLSQRLQSLKEKEFAEARSLQEDLAGNSVTGNFSEVVQLHEEFMAAKNVPLSGLQVNLVAEIEQDCVMEPEIILEESENCTLQYQPEFGVVPKFNSNHLCRSKAKNTSSKVGK